MSDGQLPADLHPHDAEARNLVLQVYPCIPRSLALHALMGRCYFATPGPESDVILGIGNLTERPSQNIATPNTAWVDVLVVGKPHRHRAGSASLRVGSTLAERILTDAKRYGFDTIGIEATRPSIPFWERQGFEHVDYCSQAARTSLMFRPL